MCIRAVEQKMTGATELRQFSSESGFFGHGFLRASMAATRLPYMLSAETLGAVSSP